MALGVACAMFGRRDGATRIKTMSNEQVVRDACRVIWSEGDTARIRDFYAEDYRADYPFGDGWGAGPDGAKAYADAIRAGFPDYRETIEDIVVEGDKVCVKLRIQGTHTGPMFGVAGTGKTVDFRDMTICTVRDGKIVAQSGLTDNLSIYLQLGLLEMPALGAAS
jgi:predicted ester cyclase